MEKELTFPTSGVEPKYLLVVSDYARSLAFYRDVLGATIVREISDVLCLLSFGGGEIMLTVGGGPTRDKPAVTFASPTDADRVTSELVIRVPDCLAAYEVLRSRGQSSSPRPSIGATRCGLSSATPTAISWRSPRVGSRSQLAVECRHHLGD